MPQIAQQDYIRIGIADIENPTDAEKAKIAAKVADGTIQDCLIEDGAGHTAKVIAFDANYIAFYDLGTSSIIDLEYSA